MKLSNKEMGDHITSMVKTELSLKIIKEIAKFKSESEPNIKLDNLDIINVLSSIIERRTK